MGQNKSSAVMAHRVEPADSLDFFPTPPWATRALCAALWAEGLADGGQTCWEPACGEGHMTRPLAEFFSRVHASDVHDYGFGAVEDFLWSSARRADWIVTNPPFRLAVQFALTAIARADVGVALLVRTAFIEGGERHRKLFRPLPPTIVLQFAERVPMVKGRLDRQASTATAYCWLVWLARGAPAVTRLTWIAPCRRRMEKPQDYLSSSAAAPSWQPSRGPPPKS